MGGRPIEQLKDMASGIGMRKSILAHQLAVVCINSMLILLILFSLHAAMAMEPVSLGHGKGGQIVNLDRGATGSSVSVPFMSSGFAAPAAPQAMEIDPGALVYQSRRIRDDSAALFQDTYNLMNQTKALLLQAEEAEKGAKGWANESWASANLTSRQLQDAQSLYDKVQSSFRRLDLLSRRLIYAEIAKGAAQPEDAYSTEAMQQEVIDLARRVSLLEERIKVLEKGERS
jgi:hypothetical protein